MSWVVLKRLVLSKVEIRKVLNRLRKMKGID